MSNPSPPVPHWTQGALTAALAAFCLIFSLKALQIHQVFGTSAYDLGIFAQNFWLFSQFEDPFNTVRGLNAHGDHLQPIELLFVPLYWITPRIEWLLVMQVLAVAWAGLITHRIALRLLPQAPALAAAVAIAFLINPVVHNPLVWQYHALVLALPLYLLWIDAYLARRTTRYFLLLALLLLVREDVPATTACMGLVALSQRRWREGAVTLVASILWGWLATRGLMAFFNGEGYFRDEAGTVQVLLAHLFDPTYYVQRLWHDTDARGYLGFLFLPFLLLPLGAPRWLLPAAPSILANLLIGGYNTQIGYHYSVNAAPFLLIATLVVLQGGLDRRPRLAPWAAAALLLAAATAAGLGSNVRLIDPSGEYRAWQDTAPLRQRLLAYDRELSPEIGIAASDFLLPHLANRKAIYLFPNPWQVHYWGIRGEKPHHPNRVEYLFLNPDHAAGYPKLLRYLTDNGYFVTLQRDARLWLLKRVRPEPADRDAAIRAMEGYRVDHGIRFDALALGPIEPPPLATRSTRPDATPPMDWLRPPWHGASYLSLDLDQMAPGVGAAARDVYAAVTVSRPTTAELLLGSDDGLMVWLNGRLILDHRIQRIAHLGDDRIELRLKPGTNHLYFRVDTVGGAWRLVAEIAPLP